MATEVLVPPLGQTVGSVTLVAWHKSEGDAVKQGEVLFTIETDKATLDIEAQDTGVLRQVVVHAGDQVQVLSAIALIAAPGEVVESKQPDRERQAIATGAANEVPIKQPRPVTDRILISPRARRLAEKHDLSLMLLNPTGPEGAIIERDVRAYLDAQSESKIAPAVRDTGLDVRSPAVTTPSGRILREQPVEIPREGEMADAEVLETIPVRGARSGIAQSIGHSVASAAHVTFNAEADATPLVALHSRLASDGIDVSYNALLIHILGSALRDHPRLNASLVNNTIQVWRRIHVGLAVDSDRGLLVPIIRDVDKKGLAQLEDEYRSLVERARAGHCSPEELSGGTFTLTNLGRFGIDSFTPIIHPSECATLGVGRIKSQPFPADNLVVARQTMWLGLSFDRRLVDGALAARFMQRVVRLIEHPFLLLS
jgi:pyruvate dehydrogenase E2 component (dihydrolipoamide acetyltransferase)